MADSRALPDQSSAKCYVAGWDAICGLPLGHDGAHVQQRGPGSTSWFTPTPRWDGLLNRWVKPDEPEYEAGLKRLRNPRAHWAASDEKDGG